MADKKLLSAAERRDKQRVDDRQAELDRQRRIDNAMAAFYDEQAKEAEKRIRNITIVANGGVPDYEAAKKLEEDTLAEVRKNLNAAVERAK